jgi:hypothetical protein
MIDTAGEVTRHRASLGPTTNHFVGAGSAVPACDAPPTGDVESKGERAGSAGACPYTFASGIDHVGKARQ